MCTYEIVSISILYSFFFHFVSPFRTFIYLQVFYFIPFFFSFFFYKYKYLWMDIHHLCKQNQVISSILYTRMCVCMCICVNIMNILSSVVLCICFSFILFLYCSTNLQKNRQKQWIHIYSMLCACILQCEERKFKIKETKNNEKKRNWTGKNINFILMIFEKTGKICKCLLLSFIAKKNNMQREMLKIISELMIGRISTTFSLSTLIQCKSDDNHWSNYSALFKLMFVQKKKKQMRCNRFSHLALALIIFHGFTTAEVDSMKPLKSKVLSTYTQTEF